MVFRESVRHPCSVSLPVPVSTMINRQRLVKLLSYLFLIISSCVMAYPVLFLVVGSFIEPDTSQIISPSLVLRHLVDELTMRAMNYGVAESSLFTFERASFYVAFNLLVGLVGGYVFSKLRFPGRNKVFLLFLSGLVMPQIIMIVPMYLLMAWFPLAGGNNILGQGGHGFIGNWPVLFLYGWVSPFAIFLLKQSYDMLPTEYEDAAKMDGAGVLTVIFRIYGPLLKPPLVALATITFLSVWNDYLWPSLTVISQAQWHPIAMRMQYIIGSYWAPVSGTDYPAILARTLVALWPPALLYFVLQRYLVQGLVASGLKG